MTVDIDALRRHIGRKKVDHDICAPAQAAALALIFGRPQDAPERSDVMQPGWHWAYFWAMSPRSELGLDGLPVEDAVMPKMPFPRRMFAGSTLTFHAPIRIGEKIRRETELTDLSLRTGSSGNLIFATTTMRIFGPDGLAMVDERHGVFREEVPAGAKTVPPKREAPPAGTPWQRTVEVDVVTLFRYSAVTFNPHRIHYDRPYATGVEGYPGLIVHGPFVQQCLLDFARDHNPGRRIARFEMRARAPLFDTAPFTLVGRPADDTACELWAVTPEGTIAMSANVTLA
ncbi:FAS1-like dehydratase domain-containing protein [Desertibaculum subflavum]|uniref:FAS1-like dehydratase domain-containing protein n=1 Tax=Desertibaculum subflavum TaxID=2268458 RepID=UPI000E6608C4